MGSQVIVLSTLDTKGEEAAYIRSQLEGLGGSAVLVDIGVVGEPGVAPDVTREAVAAAGGTPLEEILRAPTRQDASPIMVRGAIAEVHRLVRQGKADGILGLGGTQGTPNCAQVMQSLPYGFPKVMVSTVASGDVGPFVDIKDITMMFSVADVLGLNPVTRKILSNAAAAVWGMTHSTVKLEPHTGDRPLIGMTNLGVLTEGAMRAVERFHSRGYEVIVFHAVGSGGRAMEQMMKDGLIGAVFDYGLGEIADELFDGLRAADTERLTVAGKLGLPQVICPGGLEHVGLLVPANTIPERWKSHEQYVFHNPVILAPRLDPEEMGQVADRVCERLAATRGRADFLMPLQGTSRYSKPGGVLHDPEGDQVFFDHIRRNLPKTIRLEEIDADPEAPEFVDHAVDRLLELIEDASA